MSKESSILITVLLIDNNRWWSYSSNGFTDVAAWIWWVQCLTEWGKFCLGRFRYLTATLREFIRLWLSWWERATWNELWMARVEAGGMGGFFESCCTRSPLLLLFTIPYNVCVSQKLNFGKNLLNATKTKLKIFLTSFMIKELASSLNR